MEQLTPVQEAFEIQVKQSPTINDIKECLAVYEAEQKKLIAGQAEIKRDVQEGFTKGKNRMDGMEHMFQDHINTTQGNHKEAMNAISGLNIEIKDNKFKDMATESTKRGEEFKAYKDKVWGVVKTLLIGIIMLATGKAFGKLFG